MIHSKSYAALKKKSDFDSMGIFSDLNDALEYLKNGAASISNGINTLYRNWQTGETDFVTDRTYKELYKPIEDTLYSLIEQIEKTLIDSEDK